MGGARLLRGGTGRQGGKTLPASRTAPVLCGITLDSVGNIPGSAITAINALMASAAPYTPVVRVVFDQGQPATAYQTACMDIKATGALVMGELLDSTYEATTTTAQYSTLVSSYMATLGRNVDIWEIGNEVNGNWTEETGTWDNTYTLVIAKLVEAYNLVSAQGYQTALTLYANYTAGDGVHELSPEDFSAQVPLNVRNGLDYVLLSYYEEANASVRPTAATWGTHFAALRALYPNAWQGFGEVGLNDPIGQGSPPETLASAQSVANYYYNLAPTVSSVLLPYYCGGYFWWYFAEDCVPDTKALFTNISNGFTNEVAALG